MAIAGENVRQLQCLHHGKGSAVGAGELLICVALENPPGNSFLIFADTDKLNETSRNQPIQGASKLNSRGVADTVADQGEGFIENEIGGNKDMAGIERSSFANLANSWSASLGSVSAYQAQVSTKTRFIEVLADKGADRGYARRRDVCSCSCPNPCRVPASKCGPARSWLDLPTIQRAQQPRFLALAVGAHEPPPRARHTGRATILARQ